jgi:hypothetical protein
MTNTVTAPVAANIDQLKTITEEQWNKMTRIVTILVTSWNPLRLLIIRSGEVLASLRSSKLLSGQMDNKLLTLPYQIQTGTELLRINQCMKWLIVEMYKHFIRQAIVVHMLLCQTCSQDERKTTVTSEDN